MRWMGRTLNIKDRKSDLFNFKCSDRDLIGQVWDISKRESKTFGDTIIWALEELVIRHGAGNFQTLMGSYGEDGVKSEGQLEQEIYREFMDKYEVKHSDILMAVKRLGYDGKKAGQITGSIALRLHKEGKKVWQ